MSPVLTSIGIVSVFELTLVIAMQQLFAWLTSALFAVVLTDRFGRRTLFLASCVAMLLCLVAATAGSAVYEGDPTNKVAAYAAITFFFLFFPAYSLGISGNLGLYVSEILSFHLRVKGIAIFAAFSLIFNVINLFIIAIGVTAIAWRLYLVFIGVVVAELVIAYFLLPETRGPSLEKVACIFDGPSASIARAEGVDNNGPGKVE
jgi:MFS family permease